MLDRDIVTKLVGDLVKSYQAYEAMYEQARPVFGDITDSPLMNTMAEMVDRHITSLEYTIGDLNHTWLYWYVWETNCGKSDLSAGINGVDYPVSTIEQFVDLLVALELAV